MNGNFEHAFKELMENEGGFSNNPDDPGGATMYGITENVAREHGYQGEMRDLSLEQAKQIAREAYWNAVNGDELPNEVDFQVFDAAYNSGPHQAKLWLQMASGAEQDGVVGASTLAHVRAMDSDKLILRFDAFRLLFLAQLKTWPSFGKGWVRRIADNMIRATED